MPSLGNLFYNLSIKDMTDADLARIERKLANCGIHIDAKTVRQQIEAAIGANPFNANIDFGRARASLDAIFANSYKIDVDIIASKLYSSIQAALDNWSGGAKAPIVPKKSELRKAVTEALQSSGFEISVNKIKGLRNTIYSERGNLPPVEVSVNPEKLAASISKAVKKSNENKISLEARKDVLKKSINDALKTEKFPIRVIVEKAEAQEAVRQALLSAGLQNKGFTTSDKRAWDAQSRRMMAESKVAANQALAQQRLARAHRIAASAAGEHATATLSLNSSLSGSISLTKQLGGAIGAAYSVVALKNFMAKVVDIGGEIEQQKLAMTAILGDEGMSNTITSQVKSLSVKSPFGFMELNQYAKQLTAFQIPYNELYDTMKRLADISAGVGVDMGRIILAYGQVRAAKFLKGTELRQFSEANIPLVDMLAKRFSKLKGEMLSAGDIIDMISNKEITFEDVKAVLWELTGEGGKFYNMQEVMSESVKAKWKNLADAVDLMFADMAESTSSPLKSLAEILTELTSHWETVAGAVGGAATVFGLAKTYSLLLARGLGSTGDSAVKAAAEMALLERRNALIAESYRDLTSSENESLSKSLPLWESKKAMLASLSREQFKQLALSGQISTEEWKRMIAFGRLNDIQKEILVQTGVLNAAEIRNIRTLSFWRRATLGVGIAFKSLGRSMLALAANPVTLVMAAVSALTALWQRHSEEMRKNEEIANNISTKARDGAKNLKEFVEGLKPSSELDNEGLTSGIEQIQQQIKDYSPNPIKDINDALVDQEGNVRSLAEQYDVLKQKVEALQLAYQGVSDMNMGEMTGRALSEAAEGWFWDGLSKNAKDYSNALERRSDRIAAHARKNAERLKKQIDAAIAADEAFAEATKGMTTYEEKLQHLAETIEDYPKAYRAFNFKAGAGDQILSELGNYYQIRDARKELLSDTEKFIDDMNSRLKAKGVNPAWLSEAQKTELIMALKSVLNDMEEVGDDAKALMAKQFEDAWGLVGRLMEDRIGPAMQEKFRTLASQSTDEGIRIAVNKLKVDGYNALSDAEKKVVDDMMNQARDQVMRELGITHTRMQDYLSRNPLTQQITLSYTTQQKPSELYKEILREHGYNVPNGVESLLLNWTSDGNILSAGKKANAALKEAKEKAAAAKKTGLMEAEAQKELENVTEAIEFAGLGKLINTSPDRPKGGKQKDPLVESIKQRLKERKDAWSEFKKWEKIEGREAAAKRIGESGLFPTLPKDQIPQTEEEYRELIVKLEDELRKGGVKSKERKDLLNDLMKEVFSVDKTIIDEQLKHTLDTVSKEAERQLDNWNLFDKIRKSTGNEDFAMSIAFGLNADVETDYPKLIEQQLNKQVKSYEDALSKKTKGTKAEYTAKGYTYESMKELYDKASVEGASDEDINAWLSVPEELRKAWEKANENILRYFNQQREEIANIVEQYRSTEEEIIALTAEANEKKRKINEDKNLTPEEKQSLTTKIDAELNYEVFLKSGEYLKFFNAVLSMTKSEAESVGEKIKEALNDKLRAGVISAKDYLDEMEKIDQQIKIIDDSKGDFATFLSGGIDGVIEGKLNKARDEQAAAAEDIKEAEESLDLAIKSGDLNEYATAIFKLTKAQGDKSKADKDVKFFEKVSDSLKLTDAIMSEVDDIAQGLNGAFGLVSDMADSFGIDTSADTSWGAAGAFLDAFSQASGHATSAFKAFRDGDFGSGIEGVVGFVTSWFTTFNRWHDAKLQAQIDKSKKAVEMMQAEYDLLEKQMAHFLGNAANMSVAGYSGEGGAYGKQKKLLEDQLNELRKQRQLEASKKNADEEVLRDMYFQIQEAELAIREFVAENAKDLYGIDLKDWASQLGDALFEAWKRGEDGAEAFKKKAGEILAGVMNDVLRLSILEPMMESVSEYLFGSNGKSGAFGNDFEITPEEIDKLAKYLMEGMEGVDAYNQALEELEKVLNEKYGLSMKDDEESDSGASAGIQGVTEETADLLASYINAVRADVSEQTHVHWPLLLDEMLPQINVVSQAQLEAQRQIADNTLRNAIAAEAIQESTARLVLLNQSMEGSWRRIAQKEWGSY